MYAQNIPIIDLKTCSKHEQDVPCPTHFEYLIARIKIQQKLFISSFLSFDKNSISIRGRNEGVGGEGKRNNVEEKEWNYTMSRHKRVVPLPRLFTAQCTPACIHAERVYAAQLTTISASFHNASTHVQREDVYAYAAIIVCPARIPSSSRSPLSNILPCKSNYMLVSNAQAKITPVLVRHSSSRLVKSSLVNFVNASHWLSNRRRRGNVAS